MPTYVYRREDGSTFEIEQRITAPALETCPETGQPVKRVISGGTGLVFKGSGFYLTDYARKSNGASKDKDSGTSKDSGAANSNESSEKNTTAKSTASAGTESKS